MSRSRIARLAISAVFAIALLIPTVALAAPERSQNALPKGWQVFRQPDQGISVSLPSMWFGGFMDSEAFESAFGSLLGDALGGSDSDISGLLGGMSEDGNQAQLNTMFIGIDVDAIMNEEINMVGVITMANPTNAKVNPLDEIISQLETIPLSDPENDTSVDVDNTNLSGYQCVRVRVDAPYETSLSGRMMVTFYGCDQGTDTGVYFTATTMDSPESAEMYDTIASSLVW